MIQNDGKACPADRQSVCVDLEFRTQSLQAYLNVVIGLF